MESPFIQSMLVRPPKILGQQLQPFSAYHALLLLQLGFDVPHWLPATLEDVVAGVLVCRGRFEGNMGGYGLSTRAVRRSVLMRAVFTKSMDVILDFQTYLLDYMALPQVWGENKPRQSGIPWPFRMVATAAQLLPAIGERDLWNMPLARLGCYMVCQGESNGMEVVNEKERAAIKVLSKEGPAL